MFLKELCERVEWAMEAAPPGWVGCVQSLSSGAGQSSCSALDTGTPCSWGRGFEDFCRPCTPRPVPTRSQVSSATMLPGFSGLRTRAESQAGVPAAPAGRQHILVLAGSHNCMSQFPEEIPVLYLHVPCRICFPGEP